jgi:hypothetical protein
LAAVSAPPNVLAPASDLAIEWLDVFPDLHRCVASRMNKAKTTLREHALGMDRPPVGHAIQVGERWVGKVRSNGAVVWASEPFATLDEAKRAVERQLAQSPELVERAVLLAREMTP